MADESAERTESATARKREETRKKGIVAKSVEVNSAFILFFGLMLLHFGSAGLVHYVVDTARKYFEQSGRIQLNLTTLHQLMFSEVLSFLVFIGPLLIGLLIIGLVASIGQVGFHFSTKALEIKWNRINPLSGLKSIFTPKRSVVEIIKNLLKVVFIGLIAYSAISTSIEESVVLVDGDIGSIVAFLMSSTFSAGIKIGCAFIVLAILDYIYQKYKFETDMKMTKEEVKEDTKMGEGDPFTKGRIRSVQRQIAYKRMMHNVPKADVVITNPTHIAVALKYESVKMNAPKVVAKGADLIAERIKKIAIENNVPIMEDKTLARTLYHSVGIGEDVPEKLFHAVAQVLAYIYRMKNSHAKYAMN